jgi:hypothetical protein
MEGFYDILGDFVFAAEYDSRAPGTQVHIERTAVFFNDGALGDIARLEESGPRVFEQNLHGVARAQSHSRRIARGHRLSCYGIFAPCFSFIVHETKYREFRTLLQAPAHGGGWQTGGFLI